MIPRFVLGIATFLLATASVADAGNRYFYWNNGKAYYCNPPAVYTSGCYVVCEDASVVKINGYPTISAHEADMRIASYAETSSRSVVARESVADKDDSHCGGHQDPHHCIPRTVRVCDCSYEGEPQEITGTKGKLKTNCDLKRFYKAIDIYEAPCVPVPEFCIVATERYDFKEVTLEYPCKDAECKELECDFCDCEENDRVCEIATCEVYQCVTDCELECKIMKRPGKVVIAVREPANEDDTLVADVVIGKVGKQDFDAYKENTVILEAATAEQIKEAIGLEIDLSKVQGDRDLKSKIM